MQPAPSVPPRTERILERLTALHPQLIDLSLDRIRRLLADLGHPERRLPPVVHVAGTNGKGSLIAYLRAVLEAAGQRVHVYTSPHLVRFNERIRLAGAEIDDAALEALLEEVERQNDGQPITLFEITTAAAFLAFAETAADVLLLETGLGGRFDATNVVDRPRLVAITPISHDHVEFLGADLAGIAAEKAGILKPGVVTVAGPQPPAAAAVLAERAAGLSAELVLHGRDWTVGEAAGRLLWQCGADCLDLPLPGLAGQHQIANAGTAVTCLRRLAGFAVPAAAIARGLASATWPARLQRLTSGPLLAALPPGGELWLDGGHNPAAGLALAATLADWRAAAAAPRRHGLVVAMKANKDLAGFLVPLAGVVNAVCGIAIPGDPHCHAPAAIAAAARDLGLAATAAASPAEAVRWLAARLPAPRLLICGSLYLAGSILAEHG